MFGSKLNGHKALIVLSAYEWPQAVHQHVMDKRLRHFVNRSSAILLEVLALAIGISAGELVGRRDQVERILGHLLLDNSKVEFEQQSGNAKPILTTTTKIDVRQLKTLLDA